MNIAAIQTFLTVYQLGNLNRAADALNVTQSAVTARLDALDQSLGTRLLNRSRKGASLTKSGYAFLEQAAVIVRTWETARNHTAFPKGVTQLFSFVCDAALWIPFGRDLLQEWRTAHPDIAFEVWHAATREAGEWLGRGLSDAALTCDPIGGAEIRNRIQTEDVTVQVATQPRTVVRWDPAYIFVDYGLAFRDWHAETWPGDETARLRFSNPTWALDHLLAEEGSAYLPKGLTQPFVNANQLFEVTGAPSFARPLILNWSAQADRDFPWLREQ